MENDLEGTKINICRNCDHSHVFGRAASQPHPADILGLLRGGHVKSRMETDTLKDDLDSELSRIGEEIRHLRSVQKQLGARSRKLDLQRRFTVGLSSPVRKLPVEILSDIFVLVCEKNEVCAEKVTSTTVPALCISQVCKQWRDVALTFPSLWSKINMHFPKHFACACSYCSDDEDSYDEETECLHIYCRVGWCRNLLELYLFRSQNTPLDICIASVNDHFYEGFDEVERSFAQKLERCSNRWNSLTIQYTHCKDLSCNIELSMLQTLKIVDVPNPAGYRLEPYKYPLGSVFKNAPVLHSVDSFLSLPQLPWKQITSVHYMSGYPGDVHQLLCDAPQLQSLSISGFNGSFYHDSKTSQPTIHSAELRKLTVTYPFKCERLLEIIECPSLQHFGFNFGHYPDQWTTELNTSFMALYFRSGFCLTVLSLIQVDISVPSLQQILEVLPGLRTLQVVLHGPRAQVFNLDEEVTLKPTDRLTDALFGKLTLPCSADAITAKKVSQLLPKLTHLDLSDKYIGSSDNLYQIIRSRSLSNESLDNCLGLYSRLKEVNLTVPIDRSAELEGKLDCLKRLGVHLTISTQKLDLA